MKHNLAHMITVITAVATLSSCASTVSFVGKQPDKTMPAKQLFLDHPTTVFPPIPLTRYTLPAGIYKPFMYNGKGSFYESPQTLVRQGGVIPAKQRGGIFWKNGDSAPNHFYYHTGEMKVINKAPSISGKVKTEPW